MLDQLYVGDETTFCVLRTPRGDEDLLVSLNKGLEQEDWLKAKEHLANEESLKLEVIGYNKGGLIVDFGHLQGFVPASQVPQLQGVFDRKALVSRKAELVGEELPLKVIEVSRACRRLILSSKQAQKEHRQQRLQELKRKEGEIISGRVTNLVHFGAFVDLDGIDGLIHVSEIAWQKVDHPAEFLERGEEVEVFVQSVDIEQERVSLSRKEILPSPWDSYAQAHAIGDLVEGIITSVTDFGAFVRLAEGVEGLLHVSEMRGNQDIAPQTLLNSGDTILVPILSIQPEKQRLSLSQQRITQDEEIAWIRERQQTATETFENEGSTP